MRGMMTGVSRILLQNCDGEVCAQVDACRNWCSLSERWDSKLMTLFVLWKFHVNLLGTYEESGILQGFVLGAQATYSHPAM